MTTFAENHIKKKERNKNKKRCDNQPNMSVIKACGIFYETSNLAQLAMLCGLDAVIKAASK